MTRRTRIDIHAISANLCKVMNASYIYEDVYTESMRLGKPTALHYSQDRLTAYEFSAVERAMRDATTALKQRKAAADRAAAEVQKLANDADTAYFLSEEFREEVINTMVASLGITRMMAEGRTRDQARLFAEAEKLGLM